MTTEKIIIFIAAVLATACLSSHCMHRFMIWVGEIKSTELYPFPLYSCIIVLCIMSYVVWKVVPGQDPIITTWAIIFIPAYLTCLALSLMKAAKKVGL